MSASSFHSKKDGLAGCATTQLDLFDHSVCDHTVAASLLCTHHAPKARCMMETRAVRGLEIASQSQRQITYSGTFWTVPSQSSAKSYAVTIDPPFCTCPDFKETALKCKHVFAVEYHIAKESGAQLPEVIPQKRKTYRQEWHEYNLAQTNEKAHFQTLLYALCQNIEEPPQVMGRPRAPFSDVVFAACMKIYGGMSGRRSQSDVRDSLQRGHLSKQVHYNTLSKYLEKEELTPLLKQLIVESSLPLKSVETDFAVDSSGFSTGLYQKWVQAKWGAGGPSDIEKRELSVNKKDWVKVHAMTGVRTNVVTSVEVTHAHAHDSPYFKSLVETTAQNFKLGNVSADKGYSSETNMHLVLVHGGQPYIAFRKNATAANRRSGSVWKRLFLEYQINQDYFMERYHKRSNVETTFSMIKRKFGERLRNKTETAQINEVLCKVLCHNLCVLVQSMYELGVEVDFGVE